MNSSLTTAEFANFLRYDLKTSERRLRELAPLVADIRSGIEERRTALTQQGLPDLRMHAKKFEPDLEEIDALAKDLVALEQEQGERLWELEENHVILLALRAVEENKRVNRTVISDVCDSFFFLSRMEGFDVVEKWKVEFLDKIYSSISLANLPRCPVHRLVQRGRKKIVELLLHRVPPPPATDRNAKLVLGERFEQWPIDYHLAQSIRAIAEDSLASNPQNTAYVFLDRLEEEIQIILLSNDEATIEWGKLKAVQYGLLRGINQIIHRGMFSSMNIFDAIERLKCLLKDDETSIGEVIFNSLEDVKRSLHIEDGYESENSQEMSIDLLESLEKCAFRCVDMKQSSPH
ncbi:MAG: hypothetical protein RIQ56_449 [Candidatus Parcubacteria bacterium]